MITKLEPNEVFVFGSNLLGFHGAGAAGFAFYGSSENRWRESKACRDAIRGNERRGKWAVWGQAEGFMHGKEGLSYAIPSVTRPGTRRSIPLEQMQKSFLHFWKFAASHPELTFLITKIGQGYGGWDAKDIEPLWQRCQDQEGALENVRFL